MGAASSFAAEHGGRAQATPFGRDGNRRRVGRWAVCTGAGADTDTLREAGERKIQTLIVGEGPHWTAVYAEENDLVLIYVGHYASETLGVQALAAAISAKFGIPWEFIPAPTGT
jgi:putative NIF3 family GTP cyclohydrolase 1 type 2